MNDSTQTPDHSRALIRQYKESEWRSIRLEVLKTLGAYRDSRAFQFLVDIIKKNEDLAEQQIAMGALSKRKDSIAASFLRKFYEQAPQILKAHLAYALGQVQDEASASLLLHDFDLALSKQDILWLRNIILSLGELKVFAALPQIRKLVGEHSDPSLLMAALFALGRLERDPSFLQSIESKFEDSLMVQVFHASLSQVQIRSQFKLEDYLSKIFTLPDPHPVLPLELKAFDESEIEMGLELFDLDQHWKRMLFALRGVKPEKRLLHYQKILGSVRALDFADESTSDHENEIYFWEQLKREAVFSPVFKWAQIQKPPYSNAKNLAANLTSHSLASLKVGLKWLECCFSQEEVEFFLTQPEEQIAIQAINIWSENALASLAPAKIFAKLDLKNTQVETRMIRAVSELGIATKELVSSWVQKLNEAPYRSSVLSAIERFPEWVDEIAVCKIIQAWPAAEKENLGLRILGLLEALATAKKFAKGTEEFLKLFSNHFNIEFRIGVLRVLRAQPLPEWESYVIDQASHQNAQVALNAVIALKAYSNSTVASEALIEKLNSKLKAASAMIEGRALDSLCAHAPLVAKRGVMEYLKTHLADEAVVDKIYRSFDPQKKGGLEFTKQVDELLQQNPEHSQWEKLVQLRDRLKIVPAAEVTAAVFTSVAGMPPAPVKKEKSAALKEVDQKLIEVIPHFLKLDFMAQSALRAAEQTLTGSEEMQNLPIDKAPLVLEYCKALDLILEKNLGQKFLFPKLDTSLHDFQTLWHRIGFIEDYPSADKVMGAIGVKGKMSVDHFPLHKAKLMAATFFNGKIIQDRFKVFDGLRAWAVIFLVFARKLPQTNGPLLKLPHATDDECISVAKRLMVLQDLRNPAAHRQTYTDLETVKIFRNEAIQLLNTILKFYE